MSPFENLMPTHGWHILGTLGGLIFYSRFYVQWYISEREGQSLLPEIFWHMSTAGSFALLIYAVATRSPLGVLSQSFNMVVYTRNLIHIWRRQEELPRATSQLIHGIVAFITIVALGFVFSIWLREYQTNQGLEPEIARRNWIWLAVGVAGQALFAARSLVQWIATEREGDCVVPRSFWRISIVATVLQAACYLQRVEWVFAVGSLAVLVVYLRNLSLSRNPTPAASTGL